MINKDETLNNAKFNENCRKFGLQSGFIDKIGDTIVVTLINNGIRVIFNDKFDVIGIHAALPEYSYGIAFDLANIYDKNYRYKSDRFVYPFDELSFKNISDIADMVEVREVNHGHSSILYVNGKEAFHDFSYDQIKMISYIKYLDYKIKEYFLKVREFTTLGIPVVGLHQYLNKHISMIESCILEFIKYDKRPFPVDVISYTGSDRELIDNVEHELYHIISLMLSEKGLEIDKKNFGYVKESKNDNVDLSILVDEICEKLNIKEKGLNLKK